MSKRKTNKKKMKKAVAKKQKFPSFTSDGKSRQISVTVDAIMYEKIKHLKSQTRRTHKDLFIKAMHYYFGRLGYED